MPILTLPIGSIQAAISFFVTDTGDLVEYASITDAALETNAVSTRTWNYSGISSGSEDLYGFFTDGNLFHRLTGTFRRYVHSIS